MSFVSVTTCWEKPEERNLEFLGQLYRNQAWLLQQVDTIFEKHLPVASVEGKKILLKPNLVKEDRFADDAVCLRTHDLFILAALEAVLMRRPAHVMVADAPIQGCDWEKMASGFAPQIQTLSKKYDIPVEFIDFRRVSFNPRTNQFVSNRRDLNHYVIFDTGQRSFLDPVCNDSKKPFRVLQYRADRLARTHCSGKHQYCIAREFFACDTVITLPKIKTHEKTGLTNAMKILVGINGDKDFLPHHRVGGTAQGGDCYLGGNWLRRTAEAIFDFANVHIGRRLYRPLYILGRLIWKLSLPQAEHPFSAGWYGNDTTWRMVRDIDLIAEFGTSDGKLAGQPQRQIYSLCDGIIGGQGNGPLRPSPFPLGIILFANDNRLADLVAGTLMGMELEKIPLLQNVMLILSDIAQHDFLLNNQKITLEALKPLALPATMPRGWTNYRLR